jgi:UTP--glucose-1-phosphate uridylyltransferase
MTEIKAVIPAAGFGTRFLPLTKAQPKEMLPVVDRPTIQWVVEEAVEAGITDILIITGRSKRAIEDHFDRSVELEVALEQAGREQELASVRRVAELADIHYIRQKTQRGLGDAVLCARRHIGDSAFVVLLGDTICVGEPNCTAELINIYNQHNAPVFAVEEVALETTQRYGIVDGDPIGADLWRVRKLVEKPMPEEAPSRLGIIGRYLFTPDIFEHQASIVPGVGGEVQLTDGMASLAAERDMLAWRFAGERYDIGNMQDWLRAHTTLALRSRWGSDYQKWLEGQ